AKPGKRAGGGCQSNSVRPPRPRPAAPRRMASTNTTFAITSTAAVLMPRLTSTSRRERPDGRELVAMPAAVLMYPAAGRDAAAGGAGHRRRASDGKDVAATITTKAAASTRWGAG